MDVVAKMRTSTIVTRSRFFSIIVEPDIDEGRPPPKAVERPVPRPECNRMAPTKAIESNTCMKIKIPIKTDLLDYFGLGQC